MVKCFDSKEGVSLALKQIRTMPIENGWCYSREQIRDLLHKIIRAPTLYDYADEHYNALM